MSLSIIIKKLFKTINIAILKSKQSIHDGLSAFATVGHTSRLAVNREEEKLLRKQSGHVVDGLTRHFLTKTLNRNK